MTGRDPGGRFRREELATIRLRFVTERGFVSWLIRWFGGCGRWSHVGVLLDRDELQPFGPEVMGSALSAHLDIFKSWRGDLYELGERSDHVGSQPPGMQLRPAEYAQFTDSEIVEIACPERVKAWFLKLMLSQLGQPYSKRTILGFIFDKDYGRPGLKGWVCSTSIAWALATCGLLAPQLKTLRRRITPNDLYLLALQIASGAR